jgi:drug/metabolite transporter (DMT)-like permease
MNENTPSRTSRGILLMVTSTFFFLLMTLCIKAAGELEAAHVTSHLGTFGALPSARTFGALEAVFLRSAPMALVCAFVVGREVKRGSLPRTALSPRTLRWLASRGLVGATSMACLFYASLHIPLASTSLLSNTSVFFTGVLAHVFLNERLSWRRFALILVGFACVAAVLVEGITTPLAATVATAASTLGYGIALASGFLSSVAYFSVRKLKDVPSSLIILSLALAGLLIPWIGVFFPEGLTWPRTPMGWTLLLLSSVPAMLGQLTMTAALRSGPAGIVSTGQYMGPVFASIVGVLVFQEHPSPVKIAGGLGVICVGVAIPLLHNLKSSSAKHRHAPPTE